MNLLSLLLLILSLALVFGKTGEVIDATGEERESISYLLEAASEGDADGILRALDSGESIDTVNVNGWSAAAFAVAASNIGLLRTVIDHGIDLNIANNDGYTPLMLAALQSDKEMVELLLESNANPTLTTDDGVSAYTVARDSRRLINAAIILEACVIWGMLNDEPELILKSVRDGAYVNIRSTGGWNPLIYASANNLVALTDELIKLGANVNHAENENWSPLHFAAINGHEEVASLLLANDIDTEIRTVEGRTARDMAEASGYTNIVEAIDSSVETRRGQDL